MLNFDKFKEWALLGLLTGGVTILWQMNSNMSELNIKIAVMLRDQDIAKQQIIDHESRIRTIEHK